MDNEKSIFTNPFGKLIGEIGILWIIVSGGMAAYYFLKTEGYPTIYAFFAGGWSFYTLAYNWNKAKKGS